MEDLALTKMCVNPIDVYEIGYEELFHYIDRVTVTNALISGFKTFMVLAEIEWRQEPDLEVLEKLDFFHLNGIPSITELKRNGKKGIYIARGKHLDFYADILDVMTSEFFCFFEYPLTYTKEGIYIQVVGKRGDIKKFQEFLTRLGIAFNTVYVNRYHIKGRGFLSELTDRQYDCLKAAFNNGYYDIPRGEDLRRVASHLGITHGALAFHIRKAHQTIMKALLE